MTAARVFLWTDSPDEYYEGALLYLYNYPKKVTDKKGNVTHTIPTPQRVGLLVDGITCHFTMPKEVEICK